MVSESEKKINQSCIRLLASRDHSKTQLRAKLTAKGYAQSDIKFAIETMAAEGWQDDTRYAENYARSRILKGFGPLRINYELNQSGVKDFDVNTVLEAMDCSWMDLMQQVYRKKYPHNVYPDRPELAKRQRFLQQRGFSADMIKAFFDHLNEQPE